MLFIEVTAKIKKLFFFSLICLACAFFIFRFAMHRSGFLEKSAATILDPVIRLQKACVYPFKKWMKDYKTNVQLRSELAHAIAENESLIEQVNQLNGQFNFAADTKELIEYRARYQVSTAELTHILVKNFSDTEHFYLVDKGSRHGISEDMIAVYKNCLIGRISSVTPYWSKVTLITDVKCKVAAHCCKSSQQGIYEGLNQEMGTLKYISHLNEIHINDLLITSGKGLVFPHGFGIGRIAQFEPHGVYYNISVKPLVDVGSLEYCYLIKKGQ